jgi:hypothetical protein
MKVIKSIFTEVIETRVLLFPLAMAVVMFIMQLVYYQNKGIWLYMF